MYIYKVVFAIVLCKYISFSSKKEVSQAVFWLAPVQWVAKNSSADLITFLLSLSDRQWSAHHALHTQCAEDVLADGELLGSLRTLAADVHLEGAESVDAYAVATLKLLLHHL